MENTIWEIISDMVEYEKVQVAINYSQTNDSINVRMYEEHSNILFVQTFTMEELWDFASLCFYQENLQSIVNWSQIKMRVAYRFMIMILDDSHERSTNLITELRLFK